jgi:hypothetical protein
MLRRIEYRVGHRSGAIHSPGLRPRKICRHPCASDPDCRIRVLPPVVFRKFRRALEPGGTLVINDFVVNDDRSGPRFPLIFNSMMLLQTTHGATWREADYRKWLNEAGFAEVTFQPTPSPATLVFAR